MATIKSYTDINQSRKLAKILPIKSADMYYSKYDTIHANTLYCSCDNQDFSIREYIPCWSLATLLDLLESEINSEDGTTYQLNIEKDGTLWYIWYSEPYDETDPIEIESTEELIDACYEMILKLNELNLL